MPQVEHGRDEAETDADDSGAVPVGGPVPLPPGSRRDRLRSNPATAPFYRAGVFLAGLLFIVLGGVLAALPGPLTIPPVLIGLWIWSTEFRWAKRLFRAFGRKAEAAWEHAQARPVSSTLITVGGLALAAGAFWAVGHFELVAKARDLVGV